MALGDNTSNDIPLGVGYDANGNAKSFVELSAISVTNVSATQYWGLPAGSDGTLSGLSDTRVSSTGDRKPLHGESLVYSAGYWTPCAVIAGGGGGVSFPTGSTGDILYYQSDGTSVTPIVPTATPLNLATTGYVQSELTGYVVQGELASYVAKTGAATVVGPITFATNAPQFTTGFNATGPLVFTGVASFTERPTIGGTNFAIATDLNTYATTAALTTTNSNLTTFINTTAPAVYATTAALAASAISVADAYQPLNDNLDDIAAITLARGDLLYVDSTGGLVALSLPTESGGFVLKINSAGTDVVWEAP